MSTARQTTLMSSGTRIAVVMPALDEEATVAPQVRAILAHPILGTFPIVRVIVVDNGSTDATASVAQSAGAMVVSQPTHGYGAACLAGVVAAVDADIVLLMDADGSDDLDGAARVAESFLQGSAELVMGSRTMGYRQPGAVDAAATDRQCACDAADAASLWEADKRHRSGTRHSPLRFTGAWYERDDLWLVD